MAKWHLQFIVDGSRFESCMEMLVPMKVEDLQFKIVAGTPTRIRAGDKAAWEIAAAAATDKPMPVAHFVAALVKAGFTGKAAYGGVHQAVAKRALHKQKIKGTNHYRRVK